MRRSEYVDYGCPHARACVHACQGAIEGAKGRTRGHDGARSGRMCGCVGVLKRVLRLQPLGSGELSFDEGLQCCTCARLSAQHRVAHLLWVSVPCKYDGACLDSLRRDKDRVLTNCHAMSRLRLTRDSGGMVRRDVFGVDEMAHRSFPCQTWAVNSRRFTPRRAQTDKVADTVAPRLQTRTLTH